MLNTVYLSLSYHSIHYTWFSFECRSFAWACVYRIRTHSATLAHNLRYVRISFFFSLPIHLLVSFSPQHTLVMCIVFPLNCNPYSFDLNTFNGRLFGLIANKIIFYRKTSLFSFSTNKLPFIFGKRIRRTAKLTSLYSINSSEIISRYIILFSSPFSVHFH